MLTAAATINSRNGPMLFGPECARHAGLTPQAAKRRAALARKRTRAEKQADQLDLFQTTEATA